MLSRSSGLAGLFAETEEEIEEPVKPDLGQPVTEEPGWGVKQKGVTTTIASQFIYIDLFYMILYNIYICYI